MSKKGFTLVELLAVIVILAVVMVIATTAVAPFMEQARRGSLGTEGLALVDAAKMAYQAEQMSSDRIKPTQSACFSLKWLYKRGYFDPKKDLDKVAYSGSVKVTYVAPASTGQTGTYTYTFWIGNGEYGFRGIKVEDYAQDSAESLEEVANDCGGFTTSDGALRITP